MSSMPIDEFGEFGSAQADISIWADRILSEVPLIDGHNDFFYMLRGWFLNQINSPSFRIEKMPIGQTDVSRLRRGKLGGQFWSIFVPCPIDIDDSVAAIEILRKTLQQIDLAYSCFDKFHDVFAFADKQNDIENIFRSGRIASLMGVEGLHHIGNSASALRMFHRLGVRYVTLCHNRNNIYADSATAATPLHGGLSNKGREILREMNRLGIIIDLSHTSEDCQKQALLLSRAPVMFSHSSCYELCPNPRNVSDEVLQMLRENGGVIMICFLPSLVTSDISRRATVADVANHIVYAGEKIGFHHVGIGSDFDGMLEGPEGLDDVSCYPELIKELLRRGITEGQVKMILGQNIMRVLEEVRGFADREESRSVEMLCDEIEEAWTPAQKKLLISKGAQRGCTALAVE